MILDTHTFFSMSEQSLKVFEQLSLEEWKVGKVVAGLKNNKGRMYYALC